MKNTATDEFVFGRTNASTETVNHPEPGRRLRLTGALPQTSKYQPRVTKDKQMADRKEQIEMLIAAKADVQTQLDAIFAEESDKLITTIAYLSQIDPEKAAQFLAQTTYAHFNSHDEAIRSKVIDSFSAAFGSMAECVQPKGAGTWDDEDAPRQSKDETQSSIEAA